MEYLARFEQIEGEIFRFDTRIYLNGYDSTQASNCIGAIVGKNPGSASPSALNKLLPIELGDDKMLKVVGNRFHDGYSLAKKKIPTNAFVQVWNLFYLCDPDLNSACSKISRLNRTPICSTENSDVPLLWYGWGGSDKRLNEYKDRFITREWRHQFFYDHHGSKININKPTIESFAKHTQGMPKEPVNDHLASVV